MASCASLATVLDQEMLEKKGALIAARTVADAALPKKSGADVWRELGGRYLMRYLASEAIGESSGGSATPVYATPTPFAPSDLVVWLALPAPMKPRDYALLLDPREVPVILGPRWVRLGKGIEYILPEGFPASALVLPWEIRIS
jgi:hypothetical protein